MFAVWIGLLAGVFTTFASLPQIIYILRTRSAGDISLLTLCMLAVGVGLWIVYGIAIGSMPVIVWNVISLALYLTQIALKVTFSAPRPALHSDVDERLRIQVGNEPFDQPRDGFRATLGGG